jgi:hypothetical protein
MGAPPITYSRCVWGVFTRPPPPPPPLLPPPAGASKDAERACRSRIEAVVYAPSLPHLNTRSFQTAFQHSACARVRYEKGEVMQRLRDEMSDLQKGAAQRISECEAELVRDSDPLI